MKLEPGQIAVVTGAGSGIGRALSVRFARAGMKLVLADVDAAGMAETERLVVAAGSEAHLVPTDVSKEAEVQALAAATVERFGDVHLVCNNAGVVSRSDPWFGPVAAWEWVMGVNLFGVVHGIRAFLPHFAASGQERHFVNTASIAGLAPGFSAAYDASKHGVVVASEDFHLTMQMVGLPIGTTVLCPGWVRTNILEADRNWPAEFGALPESSAPLEAVNRHVARAIDESTTPAAIADHVFDAVVAGRYWAIPHDDFFDLAVQRWERIAQRLDPEAPERVPGLPSQAVLTAELRAASGLAPVDGDADSC